MKTCEYSGEALAAVRSHPWTDAVSSAAFRYLDLRASPSLIRTSLEDFVAWSGEPAIEVFYLLLEWLNGATSTLESNDCAFTGPHRSERVEVGKAFECSGRVMVLFRDLARNLAPPELAALTRSLHRALAPADPDFEDGVIGTTLVPVRYLRLPVPEDAQLGAQLMLSFWAWGDTSAACMRNVGRALENLSRALRDVDGNSHQG